MNKKVLTTILYLSGLFIFFLGSLVTTSKSEGGVKFALSLILFLLIVIAYILNKYFIMNNLMDYFSETFFISGIIFFIFLGTVSISNILNLVFGIILFEDYNLGSNVNIVFILIVSLISNVFLSLKYFKRKEKKYLFKAIIYSLLFNLCMFISISILFIFVIFIALINGF